MTRPVRERVQVHRLRKKIAESVIPGSVRVEGFRDPETGQPFCNIECSFSSKGWALIEKLAALSGKTGQEVWEDSLRAILAKMPVRQH